MLVPGAMQAPDGSDAVVPVHASPDCHAYGHACACGEAHLASLLVARAAAVLAVHAGRQGACTAQRGAQQGAVAWWVLVKGKGCTSQRWKNLWGGQRGSWLVQQVAVELLQNCGRRHRHWHVPQWASQVCIGAQSSMREGFENDSRGRWGCRPAPAPVTGRGVSRGKGHTRRRRPVSPSKRRPTAVIQFKTHLGQGARRPGPRRGVRK